MPRIRDKEKMREYQRAWYSRNATKAKAKVKLRKQEVINWFRAYKQTLSCVRCGENDPITFDFHHRDPRKKDPRISEMWKKCWGITRIQAEIAKCDVLCANCHRKVHRDLRQ